VRCDGEGGPPEKAAVKAIVWTGVDRLEVRDVPKPRPRAGEVVLRVSHVGICGSDLHILRGEHPRAKPPLIMGHEVSGTVAEAGEGVEGWAPGDGAALYPVVGCGACAVCRNHGEHICGSLGLYGIDWDGGMAEYVAVQARKLHRLPPGADMAKAALIEPLAVGLHAVAVCGFRAGSTAAVIGGGPIGVAVALCARQAGARQVLVAEVSKFRLRVAERLGFQAVDVTKRDFARTVREQTSGEGAEFVFEATGIPQAAERMLEPVSIAGTLVIVGIFPGAIPVDLRDVAFRELRLVGIRMYAPQEFDRAAALVSSGALDVAPMITDVYPLERGVEAFERTAAGTDNIKVLIRAATVA